MKKFITKTYPLLSILTLTLAASQNVSAHTGVKDTGSEGTTLYTAFTLTHGCATNAGGETTATGLGIDGNTAQKSVIAQSVLFPNANDAVFGKIDSAGYIDTTGMVLSDHIQGVSGGVLPITPSATLPQPFPNTYVVREANSNTRATGGTTRGFQGWGGEIPEGGGTVALGGFKVAGISFVSTSCAKSLKVQIAVANFCHAGGKAKDTGSDRADIWIGHMTTKFNDPLLMPNAAGTQVGNGDTRDKIYWPTLTINRNLGTNPFLDASNCGSGFDVGIHPSDPDIDANLPLALPRKGFKDLPGAKFWPTKQ